MYIYLRLLNTCDIQLYIGENFEDDHDTPKHQVYPHNTFTVSMKDFLDFRSLKQHLN